MRALLRRGATLRADVIQVADLVIDARARAVKRTSRGIEMTAKEYTLLEYLEAPSYRSLRIQQVSL
jgi:two-component system copper resistance phosphate regulon response regulator CusR